MDPRGSEPHPPSCPAQTPESLGLSVSGRSPLEILVRTRQAHRRWLRVDNLQGVFVLVLRRGPGLCPLQFGLIHRPPPCPQPGQRLGTVPAFPAASKFRPYRGRRSLPTRCTALRPTREGLDLGATLTPAPPPDQTLFQPPYLRLFLSPPLSPRCFSNTKLVCTSGPSTTQFSLPGMLFPLPFSLPGLVSNVTSSEATLQPPPVCP